MIKITCKNGNRKLTPDTKIKGLDGYITVQEIIDFVTTVENAFFSDWKNDITITVQVSGRQQSSIAGRVWYRYGKINVWHKAYRHNKNEILATICHELGHMYQYFTDKAEYNRLTDYGQELYADNFSQMCLGSLWMDCFKSYYPVYKGYSQNRIYKPEEMKVKPFHK